MSSNIATKLLPCPHCGEGAVIALREGPSAPYWSVGCCATVDSLDKDYAIRTWNTRRAPSVSVETKTEDSGIQEAVSESVNSTGQNERQHILPSAGYWFDAARRAQDAGRDASAICAMENGYNHLENALAAANDFIETFFVKGALRFPDGRSYREHAKELLSRTGGRSHAVGASSPESEPSTEPASCKFKMSIFEELLNKAQLAADELVATPLGSYHYELGISLQLAIERAAK